MKWAVAIVAGIFVGIVLTDPRVVHKFFGARTVDAELAFRSRHEKISRTNVEQELGFLRAQFADDTKWTSALRANHLWRWQLRRELAENLRGRVWLDRQLHFEASEAEAREYFAQHPQQFAQPVRYRVAHLFLAAPPATPEEVVATKRQTIDQLAQRLKNGQQFVDLVAQFSEDEATKNRGGDLGWFSRSRMPEDFMNAVRALPAGETSGVVQTKLGFHILRLDEMRPERAMNFEEARPQIVAELENGKRREAVAKAIVDLAPDAEYVRK